MDASLEITLGRQLERLKQSGQYRSLRTRGLRSFVHNDYLGLSRHPKICEAGILALEKNRAGSGGARLLGGHWECFEALEARIASFFRAPSALFFSTGYLANLAVIQSLAPLFDEIVSDEKNHASLIDGMRLSKTPRRVLPHSTWDEFAAQPDLQNGLRKLLVAESLYSMDGDCVDLSQLQKTLATGPHFLILDESHAAGIFSEHGRGLSEGLVDWERTAIVVTFGKAFGTSGAAVLCGEKVRDWMINTARSFIYTTAPPPVVAAMVEASVTVMEREGAALRHQLWSRAEQARQIFSDAGAPVVGSKNIWEKRSPIIAFAISGNDKTLRFCELMRESSVELRAIRYPTVRLGTERIRISLNLAVSCDETLEMAKEMVQRWKVFS